MLQDLSVTDAFCNDLDPQMFPDDCKVFCR